MTSTNKITCQSRRELSRSRPRRLPFALLSSLKIKQGFVWSTSLLVYICSSFNKYSVCSQTSSTVRVNSSKIECMSTRTKWDTRTLLVLILSKDKNLTKLYCMSVYVFGAKPPPTFMRTCQTHWTVLTTGSRLDQKLSQRMKLTIKKSLHYWLAHDIQVFKVKWRKSSCIAGKTVSKLEKLFLPRLWRNISFYVAYCRRMGWNSSENET